MYDTTGSAFWDRAQYYTTEAWKAVFNFGVSDQGRSENAQTGPIDASKYYVNISNPTYGNLQASDTYAGFTFERSGTEYNSDSSRLPMRILNYINAQENAGADEVVGIANANLKALNKAFADTNYWYITDKVEIAYPYTTGSGFTQDFTAAGLLALAGSDLLSDPAGTTTTVTNLNTEFGTNGMNGSTVYWNDDTQTGGGWAIGNGLAGDDVFNDALTLWGLTVYDAGNTDLARTALGASSPGLLSHMSAVDSRDPITGDLMISERGKKDTFIFSKEHFSTDSSESASTGTMRIVGFNRKQDKLGFETRDRLGTRKTTIKTFHTNSKANRLINKDTPFLLDKRTGELYTTVGSSTTDRFNDLSPFAQFIESDSSLGKIQASLI
jgi:hypothetical protein